MMYSLKQRLQYLNMPGKLSEDWKLVVDSSAKYRTSSIRVILTILLTVNNLKITELCEYLESVSSLNTKRVIIVGFIKNIFLECDDDELVKCLKENGEPTSKPGKSSPRVMLSKIMRKKIDGFFDKAIDQILRAAKEIHDNAGPYNNQ